MSKNGFIYRNRPEERFFGIGVENAKHFLNSGVIFRSLTAMGLSDFHFLIGEAKHYDPHSDVIKSPKSIPLWKFDNFKQFFDCRPQNCDIVGVELCPRAKPLETFYWPRRVAVLLGGEESGLSPEARKSCRYIVKMPTTGVSMNLSFSAAMVAWDYYSKVVASPNKSEPLRSSLWKLKSKFLNR